MNFTKYMCKTFDKENKGFVTIENIKDETCKPENFFILLFLSFLLVGVIIILAMTGDIYYKGLDAKDTSSFSELFSIDNFVIGALVWTLIILSAVFMYKLWSILKHVKVVKCPLKKE